MSLLLRPSWENGTDTTMAECIVVYRTHAGKVDAIRDDAGELAVYDNRDTAIADNQARKLFKAVPWQVVELDEI